MCMQTGSMKLLIVNDEIRTAEGIKRGVVWNRYGIEEVYVAYSTQEGKNIIQENEIDILLCDIEMPGENGLLLLKWVREQKYKIECIFLTCHANFQYAQEAISLGCQDYILIPAKYEDIGQAVLKVVNRIKEKNKDARYMKYGKYYLMEKVSVKEKETPEEVIEEIKTFILEHIGDSDLAVNSIADKFHFHPVYLNRLFKQKQGVPVSQYILDERMHLAASLLTLEGISKAEVAERIGYSYYANFHNMFKKYYGCTPFQYQENYKKQKDEGENVWSGVKD